MITQRTAWVFRRLLCNGDINGQIDLLGEPWKGMAALLQSKDPEEREAVLRIMMVASPDRDKLDSAMIEIDPNGPMPEGDEDDADEWDPIRYGTLPAVEPFPLEVLPKPAGELAKAIAKSIGCPIDFGALAVLAVSSGVIGRSASLLIKQGYFESVLLYAAMVGEPSSGKSPALKAALAPVFTICKNLDEIAKEKTDAWSKEDSKTRGEKPPRTRLLSTNFTVEALGLILAANPRGLILTKDEISQWVAEMDQYKGKGSGGDRQHFLSWWSGVTDYIDRVKNQGDPIVVPHPFLTVAGGIVPDMLGSLCEKRQRDDGFLARLLFSFPDWRQPRYTRQGIPDAIADRWNEVIRSLYARQMNEKDGRLVPHVFRFSPQADVAYEDWCNAHRDEQREDDFRDSMKGAWGKFEAYCARLALNLHLMNLASDPDRYLDSDLDPVELPRQTIHDAARLIAYFKSHAIRVYAAIGGKVVTGGDDVRALVRWILRTEREGFSTRDIGHNFDRFKDDDLALVEALGWMTEHNLIRPQSDPDALFSGKGGRKRAPTYVVNPLLRTSRLFLHFLQNRVAGGGFGGNGGKDGKS